MPYVRGNSKKKIPNQKEQIPKNKSQKANSKKPIPKSKEQIPDNKYREQTLNSV